MQICDFNEKSSNFKLFFNGTITSSGRLLSDVDKISAFKIMNFSSKLLESGVDALSSLPSIGKKTALRLALFLLKQEPEVTEDICNALLKMRRKMCECKRCHNMSDEVICAICADRRRDKQVICLVESIRDVIAIEETQQFKGVYHVLGGLISPIEGIGPGDLTIDALVERVSEEQVQEIIMAISPTIEGDTTIYYISRKLKDFPVKISTIARGVAFGGDLEYADELTLGRSILARIPYQNQGE